MRAPGRPETAEVGAGAPGLPPPARLKHPDGGTGPAGRGGARGPAGEPQASPPSLPAPPRPRSRPRRTCQGLGAHIADPPHFPPPEPGPFKPSPPPRPPQPAPPAPGSASRCRPLKLTVLPRVRQRESAVRMRDSRPSRTAGARPGASGACALQLGAGASALGTWHKRRPGSLSLPSRRGVRSVSVFTAPLTRGGCLVNVQRKGQCVAGAVLGPPRKKLILLRCWRSPFISGEADPHPSCIHRNLIIFSPVFGWLD